MNLRSALGVIQSYYPSVRSVADAKTNLRVEVTEEDDVFGNPKAMDDCAVARACRHTKGVDGALVGRSTAYVIQGAHATRYRINPKARKRIVKYDKEWSFRPGMFTLSKPAKSERLGVDYSKYKKRPPPTGKSKRPLSMTKGLRVFRKAR